MNRTSPLILLAALAACGSANDKVEQSADQLEKAAAQSDPTSAAILDKAADQVRETGDTSALSDPNSPTQRALEQAANSSAATTGDTRTRTDSTPDDAPTDGGATPAPPPAQALPNYDGQRLNRDENGNFKPRPKVIPPNARD